jgi:hypothetical protein
MDPIDENSEFKGSYQDNWTGKGDDMEVGEKWPIPKAHYS